MHDDRRWIFPSFLLDGRCPNGRASNAMHSQRAVVWPPRLFRNEHGALADATVKKARGRKQCAEGDVRCKRLPVDGDRAWLSSLSGIKISIAAAGKAVAQNGALLSRPKADLLMELRVAGLRGRGLIAALRDKNWRGHGRRDGRDNRRKWRCRSRDFRHPSHHWHGCVAGPERPTWPWGEALAPAPFVAHRPPVKGRVRAQIRTACRHWETMPVFRWNVTVLIGVDVRHNRQGGLRTG